MDKKELAKIKQNIKHDNDALLINGIGIYHVNAEKKVSGEVKKYWGKRDMISGKSGGNGKYWNLKEENIFIDIAKKTLSGKLEDSLTEYSLKGLSVVTDLDKVMAGKMDPAITKSFVEYIAEKLDIVENYAVMVIMCELTERSKSGNGWSTTDDDLCGENGTYNFMIVSICSMSPVSIGIYYNKQKDNVMVWPGTEHEVSNPISGFVYPSMSDNEADYNHVLVYNKDTKTPLKSLVSSVIGCEPVATPAEVRKAVETIVEKVVDEDANVKEVSKAVVKKIAEIAELAKETNNSTEIDSEQLQQIITEASECNIDTDSFAEEYEQELGKETIKADVIEKTVKKKAADIVINVKSNKNKVSSKMLDGKKCLVIELDDTVEVNGIEI